MDSHKTLVSNLQKAQSAKFVPMIDTCMKKLTDMAITELETICVNLRDCGIIDYSHEYHDTPRVVIAYHKERLTLEMDPISQEISIVPWMEVIPKLDIYRRFMPSKL